MTVQYSCFVCGVDLPDGEMAQVVYFPEEDEFHVVCEDCSWKESESEVEEVDSALIDRRMNGEV